MRKSIGTHRNLLFASYPSYLIDPFILARTPLLKQLHVLDDIVLSATSNKIISWIANLIPESMNQAQTNLFI